MRQRSKCTAEDEEDGPEKKKAKIEVSTSFDDVSYPVPDNTNAWPPDVIDWPLDWLCIQLNTNLFSPQWEVRHGAGTALRHLMKTQGRCGGKSTDVAASLMEESHQSWLEDMALRLVCVLTLDRFGDFVSDQVVAPVRETCAQALGSVLDLMEKKRVIAVLKVLLELLEQNDWETRHGGLLGIKYLFAVRQDLLGSMLPMAFNSLHKALSDPVDDVSAVAGGALSTAVDLLAAEHPDFALTILNSLCRLIPEQDDLTPAAVTFIPLLSQLLLKPNICAMIRADETVGELIQRLWSLLEHNNSSVRAAALKTLSCLPDQQYFKAWSYNLQPTLRHLFQRALVEHQPSIHQEVERVWYKVLHFSQLSDVLNAACPFVSIWLCLTMQQSRIPFDHSLILHPKPLMKESTAKHLQKVTGVDCSSRSDIKYYIGGPETTPQAQREANAPHARYVSAKMLGYLSTFIVQPAPGIVYTPDMDSPIDCYVKVLMVYLESKSALQRFVSGLVISEWGKRSCPPSPPTLLLHKLFNLLNESIYYDEIAVSYTRLLQDTKDFIALMKHYKLPVEESLAGAKVLTLDQMEQIVDVKVGEILLMMKMKPKVLETLQERRKTILQSLTATLGDQNKWHVMSQASVASALIALGTLPEKLTPIVKPLMESIKKEENEELQKLTAQALASLMDKCLSRNPCPNTKIVTNLCSFLLVDPDFTPKIPEVKNRPSSSSRTNFQPNNSCTDLHCGILTLAKQQQAAERSLLKRANSTSGRGPGRPPAHDVQLEELIAAEDQALKYNRIQRRGCIFALQSITSHFGPRLPQALPNLWLAIRGNLLEKVRINSPIAYTKEEAEHLVGLLQVLEVTCPSLHVSLLPQIFELLPLIITLLSHAYLVVRHMACRCLAALALIESNCLRSNETKDLPCLSSAPVMSAVVLQVVPMLSIADNDAKRQGATEAIALLLEKMQLSLVPYILFLVVPLLGRMSDQEQHTRVLATQTFANLIQMMPLDGGIPNPTQLSPQLMRMKEQHRNFLEQLFNPSTISDYKIPINICAELRSYQQSGVNWLGFLNKFKLHGLLCDDMGLGKTLQSICILASDHFYRQQQFKKTGREEFSPLPSLVVCPPTLTGHWVYEVEKFVPDRNFLRPLLYAGTPNERIKLRSHARRHQLIVASYDIVRKDIDFFSAIKWNYCILDEGHMIKNGKTKASRAIKLLTANNRLILSGTPIQNNVLELWSLFDFLMPGFLGTEKQFTARYSKPILASRDPKSSTKEQEAGVLAMEALHRQVLPFVLRRTKEDVLKDLPPKITQDYYCELSPLQRQLYEDFAKSQSHQSFEDSNNHHIFQALRYLQSVCNHPKLALTPKHPQYLSITKGLQAQNSDLSDISHAAKLPALKQLLLDCGIGAPAGAETDDIIINQHRALIFCQLKIMLDILEVDFFKAHMPSVTYLRLDGSVPAGLRHSVVTRFNNDPSIDVLILTTQVGGLGLNLTGADTVIFIEHDWSPMKDLQAMDRAHRIGQNKVVNVYRLITRDTLEEKIMGLQKFKLMTANTVISAENASLQTMGTDKLLDLFTLDSSKDASSSDPKKPGGSMKSVLDSLPELWEHKDYDEEYDMSNFIKNLRS
uniref:TATA-binding protein-associated factor 172 n=1 Tax=Lygus hesperus TaxID=30085 RepID=A0A0A9X8J8_LYGHE